jgi:hypothetical protein
MRNYLIALAFMLLIIGIYQGFVIKQQLNEIQHCACGDTSRFPPFDTTALRDSLGIQYGLLQQKDTFENTINSMLYAGIDIVRTHVMFHDEYKDETTDRYIAEGFRVNINFNYLPTAVPVPFPTDTAFIIRQATKFFKYYQNRRASIPLVSVENEWDNTNYHSGTIDQYLTELRIVTRIGHQFGFKISDAGITSNWLQRWTYSKLSGDSAIWWKQHYFVGLDNDYQNMVQAVDYFFAQVQSIPLDYLNFHWYNNTTCPDGLPIALSKLPQQFKFACNEWGVKSEVIYDSTLIELRKVRPAFAVVYSGINDPNKAIYISNENLKKMSEHYYQTIHK